MDCSQSIGNFSTGFLSQHRSHYNPIQSYNCIKCLSIDVQLTNFFSFVIAGKWQVLPKVWPSSSYDPFHLISDQNIYHPMPTTRTPRLAQWSVSLLAIKSARVRFPHRANFFHWIECCFSANCNVHSNFSRAFFHSTVACTTLKVWILILRNNSIRLHGTRNEWMMLGMRYFCARFLSLVEDWSDEWQLASPRRWPRIYFYIQHNLTARNGDVTASCLIEQCRRFESTFPCARRSSFTTVSLTYARIQVTEKISRDLRGEQGR